MMRPWIILVTLVVLIATPLAVVAAEVLDCCEAHELGPRMSEHERCGEQPCCLSPATPAPSRDTGRLTKAPPAPNSPATTRSRRASAPASRLAGPLDFSLPELQARATTVLRC